jgi:glutaredoxin
MSNKEQEPSEIKSKRIYVQPLLEKGITVYSKRDCSYCKRVKELLIQKEETILFVSCNDYLRENRESFLSIMKEWANNTEIKTFPIVFRNGNYVGGFTETKEYYDNLDSYLNMFSESGF